VTSIDRVARMHGGSGADRSGGKQAAARRRTIAPRRHRRGRTVAMNTYTAFLRIRHPSIDPAEITRVLRLNPAHAWAAGSPRATGAAERGRHSESYWFAPLGESIWPGAGDGLAAPPRAGGPAQFASQPLPLEAFLLAQIRLLTAHRGLFARIGTEGGSCELTVTLNARDRCSVELPTTLLRSLADLGIAVTLDVGPGGQPPAH
jgi:hypothetical protein